MEYKNTMNLEDYRRTMDLLEMEAGLPTRSFEFWDRGSVFIRTYSEMNGREIYVYDGATETPHLVKDGSNVAAALHNFLDKLSGEATA